MLQPDDPHSVQYRTVEAMESRRDATRILDMAE